MPVFLFAIIAFIAPLLGSVVGYCVHNVFLGRFFPALINIVSIFISAVLFTCLYVNINLSDPIIVQLFPFLWLDSFQTFWSIRLDNLSLILCCMVTYIASFVAVYSYGYMYRDPGMVKFISYIGLFTFAMLLILISNDYVQLFIGWEGVGVCSYLLIGFWNHKQSANNAAFKAFVINRIGDIFIILGISLCISCFNTVNFNEIFSIIGDVSYKNSGNEIPFYLIPINLLGFEFHKVDLICFLFLCGAMGKSAQIGLHVWLPDAMQGPTPASALIHAATMVTAGVFLIVRSSPLFEISQVLYIVTWIGLLTSLLGAFLASVQYDFKKVIAYSTCSQLGYMFLACGVSAYPSAIFHLLTHAFFKSLLFLIAGYIIYALSHEQDIRKMGRYWWKKNTLSDILIYLSFALGLLSLMGVPPLSGYYSKDLIIESVWLSNYEDSRLLFFLIIVATFFTAFYCTRLFLYVFYNSMSEVDQSKIDAARSESDFDSNTRPPKTMLIIIVLLTFFAASSGYIFDKMLHLAPAADYWGKEIVTHIDVKKFETVPLWVKKMPLMCSLFGALLATVIYAYDYKSTVLRKIFVSILNKELYFNDIYRIFIVRPILYISNKIANFVDYYIIDYLIPRSIVSFISTCNYAITKIYVGQLSVYILFMLSSFILLLAIGFS